NWRAVRRTERSAVGLKSGRGGIVQHGKRRDGRKRRFERLKHQIKPARERGGIGDEDEYVASSRMKELMCSNGLFGRAGREAVGAREIDKLDLAAFDADPGRAALDRHAGVIRHASAMPAQGIEERGLSGVRVAKEKDGRARSRLAH